MRKKTALDNVRASIQFEYYGSSIADPLSGQQTDRSTGYSQSDIPSELDTLLTAGYSLSSNLTISYNAYFWSLADSAPGADDGQRFGFRPGDSYLKFGFGKFYQAGKFKWSGDLRFYPGLGGDWNRIPLYIRNGQNLSYALSPRLSLAAYNTIRYYYRTDSAYAIDHDPDGNAYDFRVTLGPAVEYQLFDAVGVSLSFNADFAHSYNNDAWDETSNFKTNPVVAGLYHAYFELGSSIDFTKSINFNPYVDMTTSATNVEAMQVGANLHFTIL
jgi:hypothetical protein